MKPFQQFACLREWGLNDDDPRINQWMAHFWSSLRVSGQESYKQAIELKKQIRNLYCNNVYWSWTRI